MQLVLVAVLLLVALALGAATLTLVNVRRRQHDGFTSTVEVPPEVRALARAQRAGTAGTAADGPASAPPTAAGLAGAGGTSPEGHEPPPTAPAPPPPGPRLRPPAATGPHVPLVDALAGVALPCGLTYLGTVEPEPGTVETLAFTTTGHDPDDVGAAMVAELERCGYDVLAGAHPRQARASRDGISLRMEVFEHPTTVLRERKPAFPTAAPEAIVVEVVRFRAVTTAGAGDDAAGETEIVW